MSKNRGLFRDLLDISGRFSILKEIVSEKTKLKVFSFET